MDTQQIIHSLETEITNLQKARSILTAEKPRRYSISPAGRKRIAAAQKARWAKTKAA
ncbi:MAG TPA: hypothetical protein VMQ60_03185 [Acidobacteriaceae bacterium]|jgi:hypothetical protein|nr:hypothetical protein [Acidobacteriaceae bacterium]